MRSFPTLVLYSESGLLCVSVMSTSTLNLSLFPSWLSHLSYPDYDVTYTCVSCPPHSRSGPKLSAIFSRSHTLSPTKMKIFCPEIVTFPLSFLQVSSITAVQYHCGSPVPVPHTFLPPCGSCPICASLDLARAFCSPMPLSH